MSQDTSIDRIVEAVLARLGEDGGSVNLDGNSCSTCSEPGGCVSHCPETTNAIVQEGVDRVSWVCRENECVPADIAGTIDHTILKANATREQVESLIVEAKQHKFASICVNPCWAKMCRDALFGTGVKVCVVIGFPLGANTSETKSFEARKACYDGATEVDMVINIGALKAGDVSYVERDIRAVVESVGPGVMVKVIIETAYLTREEKIQACRAARNARADYVKTSTGFGPSGATVEDIRLMREVVGPGMGVKASGGIKTRSDATDMLRAGATRVGASASVAIVKGE